MAKTEINVTQLKNFMQKQIEELDQIKELKTALNKSDEDVPECTEYLNRMYSACNQVITMCNEYKELEKAKAKEEADKIKAEAAKIKAEEKKSAAKEKIAEPAEDNGDDEDEDIWS